MILEEVKKAVQPELDQDFDALFEEFVAEHGEEDVAQFLVHLHEFGLISDELVKQLADDGTIGFEKPIPPRDPGPVHDLQPIDWGDDMEEEEDPTVLAKVSDLLKMSEEAALVASGAFPKPEREKSKPPADPKTGTGSTTGAKARKTGTGSTSGARARPTPAPSAPPERAASQPPRQAESARRPVPLEASTPTKPGGAGPGGQRLVPQQFEDDDDEDTAKKRTMFRKRSDGKWTETDAFQVEERQKRRKTRRDKPAAVVETRDLEHYDFTGLVGEGAMGSVHLAQDKILNRRIAYKEMADEIAEQPALASKFTAEAQITAQLEHPNIVPVYTLEGEAAYTMKLIRGRTVENLIQETRELYEKRRSIDEDHSLEGRLDVFLKVCDAIAFANARGVVHRDLKPENIMLGEFGEVYVMDWGIAHLMSGDFDEKPRVEGMEDEGELIIGTVGYMSPEQADGRTDELTGASDQYALGLILFELVALKEAVTGKNRLHMLTRQQEGETDNLIHRYRERIPDEIVAIVRKATQTDPNRRYPSVDHLGDDIRRFLRGEAVRAKPDNPWQALVRWTGRHRQATLLAAMFVIFSSVVMVLLVGVWTQISMSRTAAREQAVSNLVTTVGRQASYVDGQFLRLEGLLAVLAASAEDLLVLGDASAPIIYTNLDYNDGKGPPDVEESRRYRTAVSTSKSVFVVPPTMPVSDRLLVLPKLDPMNRHYQKVLLRSLSEEAATMTPLRAARAITDVGTPIAWAFVGLENGAYNVYPGHGGYIAGYDTLEKPWYKAAAASKGPQWGMPVTDDDGGRVGTVMTCSMPLFDRQGERLGVVGVDVSFDYLADQVLEDETLKKAGARAFILDTAGRIIVDPEDMKRGISGPPKLYDDESILEAVAQRRSGYEERGDEMVIYTRMTALDWYYVIEGPTDALLASVD